MGQNKGIMPPTETISKGESSHKRNIERLRSGLRSGIDLKRFWDLVCPNRAITPFSVHDCLHCGANAVVVFPKLNRDWYFQCRFCGKNWNMLTHLKMTRGFDLRGASQWMARNGIIGIGDYSAYARHTKTASRITEIIERSKAQPISSKIEHFVPGEMVSIPKELNGGLAEMVQHITDLPVARQLYAMVFRDITGLITGISIYLTTNRVRCCTINILEEMHQFFCPSRDGFRPGDSVWIMSNKSARIVDLSVIPDHRKLLIEKVRSDNKRKIKLPPEWWGPSSHVTIVTTPQTLAEDMQGFGSLMNFFTISVRTVDLDGRVVDEPVAESIARSEMCPFIVGHLVYQKALLPQAAEQLKNAAGLAKKPVIENVEQESCDGWGEIHLHRKKEPRGNFSILCHTKTSNGVSIVVSFGGASMMRMNVSSEVFLDSNKLYEAVVRRAIENRMPFPVVYRKHPLPLNYLND
jgi:hypothetical protein